MRTGTRAAALAGIAALVATGAAACGQQGGSLSRTTQAAAGSAAAVRAVQVAYTTTTSAKTAAFRLTESIQAKSSTGSSLNATVTGSGQVDFATRAFTATLNAPSGGAVQVLLTAGTEYLQVPAAARSQIPGHKPWVSHNMDQVRTDRTGTSVLNLASAGHD